MKKRTKEEKREAARKRINNDIQNTKSSVNLLNLENYDNVNFFKITKDQAKERTKFNIDILPYVITSDNHPKGVEKGFVDYKFEYWRHQQIGPDNKTVLCLNKTFGKDCPLCEQYEDLKDELGWEHKDVKAIKAKRRTIMNIIDLANEDKGIQLWDVSWHIFDSLLLVEVDDYDSEEQLLFYDIEEGKTIKMRSILASMGETKFASIDKIDFIDRDAYEDSIENETYPLDALIQIPTFDEVKKLISGMNEDDEDEEVKEEKTERKSKKREVKEEKEETKEKTTRQRRTRKTEKKEEKEDNKCSSGYEFGNDCNDKEECANCDDDIFAKCSDQYEELANNE